MTLSQTPSHDPVSAFRDGLNQMMGNTHQAPSQPQAPATPALPAAATPQAPATPAPLRGDEKRAQDARDAQRAMSHERNKLEAVLRQASGLTESLESLVSRTAAIKDSVGKVPQLSFTPQAEFDPAVKADHPWLFETVEHIHRALGDFSSAFNALLSHLGGYAESVAKDREKHAEQTFNNILLALDRNYPMWRSVFAQGSPESQQFDAWLNGLPGPKYVAYDSAIKDCNSYESIAQVFDEYEEAFPGSLHTQKPHAAAPGGPETQTPAGGGSGVVVKDPNKVEPLTEQEAHNFQNLLASASTKEEQLLLTRRHQAYVQESLQRLTGHRS